ncbi:PERQ amino acid-rich with GYF domain-containing protein CG11148 [Papilio xuthus]|uniref:PERQ amino acid-rich with GYF domain-containing protein CG11148 n=1 Tax=Papilio xuthus TaxID=66420 RepID=A0A194PGP2_PAPXU|nr:PERQ amino acid-rich with GYF domain-containing protein CG11148 [Papilio xuthus]
MGDRNNPIKFGPAWMRNFGQISSTEVTTSNNQNSTNSRVVTTTAPKVTTATTSSVTSSAVTNTQGQTGDGAAQDPTNSNTTPTTTSGTTNPGNSELVLAEMRYGREEMLALYERTTDAPEQLKYFDQLYQQRRKPPVALNNTFQEEMQRENTRGAKPAASGRNLNRTSPNENRRTRTPFPRNASSGKGVIWNTAQKKTGPPTYHPTFEANTALSWGGNNGNTPQPPPPRSHVEQHERSGSKVYRRRVNNNTNWRQHSREEDEWRSRNRPNAERDWGERPQGKQSTWNSNRSGWVGEASNEESLPEWAVENAVGRTGTFDSTGAFHGYSNDDTNIPKTSESSSSFQLVRSLTHGSLVHNTKIPANANGMEEWWTSDKAKKLSPNKLEPNDAKFKQASNMPSDDNIPTKISKEENIQEENDIKAEETNANETSEAPPSSPKTEETDNISDDTKEASLKSKFVESKTFDALMRSDINLEKVTDEKGNLQSCGFFKISYHKIFCFSDDSSASKNLAEEMVNLTVDDSNASTSKTASTNANASGNQTDLQVPTQMPSSSIPLPSPRQSMGGMQAGGMPAGGMQAGGTPAGGMQAGGMQVGILQAGGLKIMQAGGIQVGKMQAGGMQGGGMHGGGMQGGGMQGGGMQGGGMHGGGMHGGGMHGGGMHVGNMQGGGMHGGHMQGGGMHGGGMQSGIMQAGGMQSGGMQAGNMQAGGMQLHSGVGGRGGYESLGMQLNTMQPGGIHFAGIHPGMQTAQAIQQTLLQQAGLQSAAMQGGMHPGELQSGRDGSGMQGALQAMQVARMGSGLQNVGVPNQALNTAMGLPTSGNGQVIPMPGVSRPMMQNPGVMGLGAADMQANASMMSAYHQQTGLSMMSGSNIHNSSLFMVQPNNSMQAANDFNRARAEMYQAGQQQAAYGSMYNMMPPGGQSPQNNLNVMDQWYYEDPQYNVHGPFSSKDMYNWYKAGFFNSNLMIRRACDVNMRRLGSYGPMAFGAPIDLLPPYPPPTFDRRTQGPHDLLNPKGLGLEETLWRQSAQSPDMLWMTQSVDPTNEAGVNNLPMHFWDTEPSTLTSKSLLPEKSDKKIKPEDQIAAQPRASQNVNTLQKMLSASKECTVTSDPKPVINPNFLERLIPNLGEIQKILKEKWLVTLEPTQIKLEDNVEPSALTSKSIFPEKIDKDVKSEDQVPVQLMPLGNNQSSVSTTSSDSQSEVFPLIHERTTPNLEEIQNLLQIKWLVTVASSSSKSTEENEESEVKGDQVLKEEEPSTDSSNGKQDRQNNSKPAVETKVVKSPKPENDKSVKGKTTKGKNKKTKVGKKEEVVEPKTKEDIVKTEVKKSDETTSSKTKKEEKQSKKEVEKEGKDVKEGTKEEVKGNDRGVSKESKKKENAKGSDADSNRKEVAVEEKKGKKIVEKTTNDKKQQPEQLAVETVQLARKTPWSDALSAQAQSANNYSMNLSNIQRLEREKKIEEIKMQQRMIQIIASQQAETLAREKIMQARLHWAKTRPPPNMIPLLSEIQAEARMQAAAESSAAAMAHVLDDAETLLPPIPNTPWASSSKSDPPAPIGFWDAQHKNGKATDKPQESQKVEEANIPIKNKTAISVNAPKEVSPAVLEFDSWCKNVLMVWDKNIDVTTFVSFLKDIESPYDVKDYVKFYLGETKDANDFARLFLEKRSKLMRVGTVTPSDDLCSPAVAINPRMSLNLGYQEVKSKGKKAKKNKMLKVDSRILGFSVTAAEDRINVGDIDTA